MKKIKLVWEFYGEESEHYAKHHYNHLNEFLLIEEEKIPVGYEKVEDDFFVAYIIIPENRMIEFRDKLRPNNAFIIS